MLRDPRKILLIELSQLVNGSLSVWARKWMVTLKKVCHEFLQRIIRCQKLCVGCGWGLHFFFTTTKGKFRFFQMPFRALWHHRYLWALLSCLIPSLFRIKLRFLLLFDVHHGQVQTSFIIVNLHKAKNAFSGMPHLRMSYVEIIQAQLI